MADMRGEKWWGRAFRFAKNVACCSSSGLIRSILVANMGVTQFLEQIAAESGASFLTA